MKAYFNTSEKQAAVIAEARSWMGTPFRPHHQQKGVGVDCVRLGVGIYQAVGFLGEVELPRYTIGAGSHLDISGVAQWIEATGKFFGLAKERLSGTDFNLAIHGAQPGDALGFKVGRVVHHVGIVTERRQFVHCYQNAGTIESTLDDPTWSTRLQVIWRPLQSVGSVRSVGSGELVESTA